MKALIDGDIMVYSCGAAADRRFFVVDNTEFDLISQAREYISETYGINKESDPKDWRKKQDPFIKRELEGTPVQYSLSNVKELMHSIMDSSGATTGQVFLTSDDKSNYRFKRATIKEYKGNRKDAVKPTKYHEMREYLVKQWGAQVIHGAEADDAMGYTQYQMEQAYEKAVWDEGDLLDIWESDRSIICSCDKDMDMIPGWHYNWQKDKAYEVSEEEAWRFFYWQLLVGDSTDNIPGCPGVGEKNPLAMSIKDGTFPGGGAFSRRGIERVVSDRYVEKLGDKAWEAMRENADLLWIQREKGVLWEPVIENPISEGKGEEAPAVGGEPTEEEVRVGG
jgi:hypothetical protein